MSKYIIGVCTVIDVDSGEEIDKYYKIYPKASGEALWFEWGTLKQAREYVKKLEEKESKHGDKR